MTDEDKTDYKDDDSILEKARREYRMCVDHDGDNFINAKSDLQFLSGGENQWDPVAVAARKADGRPVITVNSMPTYLHQVTNDQRQNSPSIKVHPVGDDADIETAKIRQGMIRHIEYDSNADIAYDRAVNSAAAIGFGYWRLVTEYESPTSFDQKIMFKSIRNSLSVRIDPLSVEPDGSDMRFAFIEYLMDRKEFKEEYPKAKASDESLLSGETSYIGWISDQNVLICDYYCIQCEDDEVVLLSNGESGFKSDLLELPEGVTIVNKRKGEKRKVMLYKVTGVDILERTEIKCRWIPVFPVYGDEIDIEGKVIRAGIIRNAKGPAQAYNVMMSAATEEVALRTKAPYIGVEGQFEGHEDEWAQANSRAFPYLEYKGTTVDGQLAPHPQRQPMADVPVGMLAMAAHAADNIKKTTGLFDASLGARGTATSGKQEIAQQREGDMANYHYADGLNRTVLHCGRCINDMIPHYYDAERVVKILREDDTVEHAVINQVNVQQKPNKDGSIPLVLNDMTGGQFDVTVSAGPSYSTLRQEAAEGMAENMAKNPALWSVIGDLYVKNQDWPGADAMAARIKKTIPPQLLEDENKDEPSQVIQTPQGPIPVDQVPQMLGDLNQQLQMAQEAMQKAQVDKQQAEVMKQQNEQATISLDAQRLEVEKFNAETERLKLQQEADIAQAEALVEAEKYRAEQMRIQAEAMKAEPPEPVEPQASLEDMAKLIIASRPALPSGMKVKAPSGGFYDVEFTGTLQ